MSLKEKFKNIFKREKTFKKGKPTKYKVGITFGGGGTKGLAHLGAVKAFEEEGIEFDYITGTSAGAIVGALYAKGYSAEEMITIAKTLNTKDIKTSKIPLIPSKTEGLEEVIKKSIGDIVFSDLKRPLSVIAVDMKSGKEIDITSGNVVKAVAGSCALPLIFNPVEFNDYMLMDGGLTNTIPANIAKNKGCKYVISVDVNPARGYGTKSFKLIDVAAASIRIMMSQNARRAKLYSDIIIEPNTKRFKASKLDGMMEMIEEGYIATKEKMPQIKKMLHLKVKKIKTSKQKLKELEAKLEKEQQEDMENMIEE